MLTAKDETQSDVLDILVACKTCEHATEVITQVRRSNLPFRIHRVLDRECCREVLDAQKIRAVIADYDFGIFPFINDLRSQHIHVPFLLVTELELSPNTPQEGLNISILRSHLDRIPEWLSSLAAAGFLNGKQAERSVQVSCIREALSTPEPIMPSAGAGSRSQAHPPIISAPDRGSCSAR